MCLGAVTRAENLLKGEGGIFVEWKVRECPKLGAGTRVENVLDILNSKLKGEDWDICWMKAQQ